MTNVYIMNGIYNIHLHKWKFNTIKLTLVDKDTNGEKYENSVTVFWSWESNMPYTLNARALPLKTT